MKSWEQCAMKSWEQYSPDWIKLEPKSANDKGKAHGYYRGVGNTVDVLWGVEGEAAAPNYHDICLEQGLAIDMDKMPHIVDMVVKEYEVDRLINHSLYEKLAAFLPKRNSLRQLECSFGTVTGIIPIKYSIRFSYEAPIE
jgi:hypothetical protein